MSDEEELSESGEVNDSVTNEGASEVVSTEDSLKEKFRLTGDEEILKDVKPSFFAFLSMYFIALIISRSSPPIRNRLGFK